MDHNEIKDDETSHHDKDKLIEGLYTQDEAARLIEINQLRGKLLNLLTQSETGSLVIPEKAPDKMLMMALIDGSEKQVITKVKLRAAKKAMDKESESADLVAKALMAFRPSPVVPAAAIERELPKDFDYDSPDIPGQTDIGNIQISPELFKVRTT